jgi:hypothetical protein
MNKGSGGGGINYTVDLPPLTASKSLLVDILFLASQRHVVRFVG